MVEKSRNSLRHKFGEKRCFLLYLTLEKMIDNTSTEKLAVLFWGEGRKEPQGVIATLDGARDESVYLTRLWSKLYWRQSHWRTSYSI